MENIFNGIDEIVNYTRKSAHELLRLKRDFGFPMEKKNGIFCASPAAIHKWMKEWCFEEIVKISYTDCEVLYLRRLRAKEPGKMLSGDINAISENLKISPATLLGLLKNEDCPVQRIPGTNRYKVDTKNWRDYHDMIYR